MDHATPNLPSRDFEVTFAFYEKLGFSQVFRDDNWMILTRGSTALEFFPMPQIDPTQSWFSCCLRLDNIDPFFEACVEAAIEVKSEGAPRIHLPLVEGDMRMGALIDCDGTLLRVIERKKRTQSQS